MNVLFDGGEGNKLLFKRFAFTYHEKYYVREFHEKYVRTSNNGT